MIYFLFSILVISGLLVLKYYKLKELAETSSLNDSDEWLTLTKYLERISKKYLPAYTVILIVVYSGSDLITNNQTTTVLLLTALGYMHFMNTFILISAVEKAVYEQNKDDE